MHTKTLWTLGVLLAIAQGAAVASAAPRAEHGKPASDAASHGSAARAPLVRHDEELYTKGRYIAYAAPWSAKSSKLQPGKDFVDTITIDEATFPAGTKMAWHWPLDRAKKTGVRGYNTLSYGNYDSGLPQQPVKPLQVKAIRSGWQSFAWRTEPVIGDFNLLAEFYLTRTAGASDAKTVEIGFMLHAPAVTRAWTRAGIPASNWTDAYGVAWEITRNQGPGIPYIILMPRGGGDLLKGRLDVKGALAELRRLGLVSGDEWLNGTAFGVEPISGSGFVIIDDWTVHW
jgi:hypothetical protein